MGGTYLWLFFEEMMGESIAEFFPSGRLDEEAQILARLQRGER